VTVEAEREELSDGVVLLRRFAGAAELLAEISRVAARAPFRFMATPGGRMSVAMTNCGELGWTSDESGYRYTPQDPLTGKPWPGLPRSFAALADAAARRAGFDAFEPDSCLINRYAPGTRLGAHQDKDERDFAQPIVSVSLGLPAIFFVVLGRVRSGPVRSVRVEEGDVVVWGGPARLAYHGVKRIESSGALPFRFNLTLRRAG
jgi:DNA oxidative demethylase